MSGERQPEAYAFLTEDYVKLLAIRTRLYDHTDRPLNGDQIRDLANAMHAVMAQAYPIASFDLEGP